MFVQIGLKTIHMTHHGGNTMRTAGTPLVGADDMVLDDSGGLLTSLAPMPVKYKGAFVSDRRSSGSEEGGY